MDKAMPNEMKVTSASANGLRRPQLILVFGGCH